MSDSIRTSIDALEAAKMINNALFDRMVEKAVRVYQIEADWCHAVRAAPESGPTRAAYEKKAGALRRLANWKRGLAALADLITAAQNDLRQGGQEAFATAAEAAYAFAAAFQYAVDVECEAAAEAASRRRDVQGINNLAEALERAYAASDK